MIPRGTAISFVDSYDSIISNNFLFDNRGRQITITRGNNVSIIENLILNEIEFDYGDTMISLIYSRFCDISRNQIIKNTTQGTQRMHGLGMWHCSQNNVTENIIYGLILEGLYLEKSNKTHVIGNVIIASNYGIGLKDSCNYNKIIYNEISVTQTVGGEKGISLENYCQHNSLLNNIVNGSKFTTENYGIYLLQSNNNSIIQNIIIDNDFGIYLIRSNLSTISENIIQNFDECITEIDCIGNTIEDNICMTETTPPIPGFDLFIIMGIFFVIFMILIKSVSKFQIRRLEVSSRETCF
jgi:parallel beta-helix repeat protein